MVTPSIIIGVDESGCGALAGPLVVGAAAFRREDGPVSATYRGKRGDKVIIAGDSKSYSNPVQREVLDQAIRGSALGFVLIEKTAQEIDERLLGTVFPEAIGMAIARILELLITKGCPEDPREYLVMVDGEVNLPLGIPCPTRTVVDGDKRVWQIGAASILAKVQRDYKMIQLDAQYPLYCFAQHKGYPTPAHKVLLKQHGASDVHRRTFRPVANCQGLPPGFESY